MSSSLFIGLLRVPWTARRSNQSILKETSPGCSLEGMMLKLKLQNFGHLTRRVDSLEKTLMLGEIGGRRRRGQQRMRWLNGITNTMHMSLSELLEMVVDREAWHAVIHGVAKSRTRLRDWTELKKNEENGKRTITLDFMFRWIATAFLDKNVIFEEPAMWLPRERIPQTEETSRARALRGEHG